MSFEAGAVEFRFEVLGDVQIRERLDGMVRVAEDWSPAFERIAEHFREHMTQTFDTGGMATAGHWPALSPHYAAWKAARYAGRPILTREGDLRKAMTQKGAEGNVNEISAHEMTVGGRRMSKDGRWDVGALHQTGTRYMPRRRIINLPEWIKTHWIQILREFMSWESTRGG